MALRGWRLFGVAGTIFAYIAGILLLSIVSLNNPSQRRPRVGRFGEFDAFRHREVSLVGKRQPLQWCQSLRFADADPNKDPIATTKHPKVLMETFAGHYVKTPKKYLHHKHIGSSYDNAANVANNNKPNKITFDDKYVDPKSAAASADKKSTYGNDEFKITYEKIWPKHKRNQNDVKKINEHNNNNNNNNKNNKLSETVPKNLIALASFPGSGNTWLRYLLQQATGIYTGSVYKDFGLLKSGFPAENIFNSSVLVVKTHEWGPNAWVHFSKAILLIRDPDKAILAEFNRQSGGHVGFASPDRYKRTKGRYWQQFVTNKLWAWEQMNVQWATNFTGEVDIIYYDDMVEDVEGTLRKTLKFINFPVNEELLACALTRKEGIYRRKKRIMTFDPYTPEMHKALEQKKREVYSELGRYKF